MATTTTKQLFVEVLNAGYVVNDGGKKIAFESKESLKKHMQMKYEFINAIIDKATTENFAFELTIDENVRVNEYHIKGK